MPKSWDDMTYHEKLEMLRQDMARVYAAVGELTRDQDQTWEALRGTRSQLGKLSKDVATLKSLWTNSQKNYFRTG
jgi:hypothetical protein